MSTHLLRPLLLIVMLVLSCCAAFAQTSAFTYQGKLTDNNGNPLTGNFDIVFKLFDMSDLNTGTELATSSRSNFRINAGLFTVELDFPRCDLCFNGAPRWLEINVKTTGSTGDFVKLSPRQFITSTPYAVRSSFAGSADFLACQNCVTSNQISTVNGSSVVGPIAVENVPAGSDFYIQKRTTEQLAANFNIGGDGRVGNHLRVGGRFFLDAGNSVGGRLTALETGNIGIGTSDPASKLHVFGNPILRVSADSDSNAGFGLRLNNALKWSVATVSPGNFQIFNDVIGQNAVWIDRVNNNVGIGTTAPTGKLHVARGGQAQFDLQNTSTGGTPAAGSHWRVFADNEGGAGGHLTFGFFDVTNQRLAYGVDNAGTFIVGGTRDINSKFSVTQDGFVHVGSGPFTSDPALRLVVSGIIATNLASGGLSPICSSIQGYLSVCSSSIRYKENLNSFSSGLNLISRLRPVSFNWKNGGTADLGLVAEEVADIQPLLATYNDKGEVEGVKYDRVAVVLINAVKEQQAQIEQQRNQIESLRAVNASLNSRLRVIEKRFRRKGASVRHR